MYAKMRGLNVLATTRRSQATEKLISIGADHVVIDDREIRDRVRSINRRGVDHAIEVVGAATLLDTASCIRPWGEVVVVGLLAAPPVLNNLNLMMDIPNTVKLSFFNSQLLGTEALPLTESPLDLIAEKVASGQISSALAKVYPFEDIQEALRLRDSGRAGGKIVVRS